MKAYLHKRIKSYLEVIIRPTDRVLEITAQSTSPSLNASGHRCLRLEPADAVSTEAFENVIAPYKSSAYDYILVTDLIHKVYDIGQMLQSINSIAQPYTRVLIINFNSLWQPLVLLAEALNFKNKTPYFNWVSPEDIDNLLKISDFNSVQCNRRVLCPIYVPIFSYIMNRFVAHMPLLSAFCLLNIFVARPINKRTVNSKPSTSIIVPARNEAGNIENIIKRTPQLSDNDELIFVEGNSTDNTWETIVKAHKKYSGTRKIVIAQQDGWGKGDAVRKGFEIANNEVLFILDADMTVPPEELPAFYQAIVRDKGDFINGSRLVYPLEARAMRFFNLIGNKCFAIAFSWVLGQRFKDTLCGTKVLRKESYEKLREHRSFFGDFDPFGDFDLLFGASRMGLEIVEIPIHYQERVYGDTNIQRWKHGWILFKMLIFVSFKIRFN